MDLDDGPDGMEEELFEAEDKKISTRSRTRSRSRSRSVPPISKIQFYATLLFGCDLNMTESS